MTKTSSDELKGLAQALLKRSQSLETQARLSVTDEERSRMLFTMGAACMIIGEVIDSYAGQRSGPTIIQETSSSPVGDGGET
jgi:hypothetical protein